MLRKMLIPALSLLLLEGCKAEDASPDGKTRTSTSESDAAASDKPAEQSTGTPSEDITGETPPEDSKGEPPSTAEAGVFPAQWIHGAATCPNQDPPLQVHSYSPSLKILRQSKCLNFEGPFIYLLLGTEKALLIDTGATANATTFPLQVEVEKLITTHLATMGKDRAAYQLIVVHSHAHGDHVAADPQFQGKAGTTVVGTAVSALQTFFNIANWATDTATYELGGRALTVIPIPGHEAAHIAVHDPKTNILFTGDTLYPGMIFVNNWTDLRTSVDRLQKFSVGKNLAHVLGAHIEMTSTPRMAYAYGTTFQPNEHVLQLKASHLLEFDNALKAIGPTPKREVHDSFIIDP